MPPELREKDKITQIFHESIKEWLLPKAISDYRILTPEERKALKENPNFQISDPLIPEGFSQKDILGSEDNFPKAIDISLK